MIPSDEDLGLIKGAHQVSEPTKESLEQADRMLDLQSTSTPLRKLMAIKFDAIRREERAKAEKLIQAIHNLYYAAVWHADRPVDEVALWTAIRDAAGFTPGNSPKEGAHHG